MARHNGVIGTLTIALNGTDSTELTASTTRNKIALGTIVDWVIFAPAALTGTVTVQVSSLDTPGASDWRALQVQSGTDVTVPAGKALIVPCAGARALRVVSSVAEGAERAFVVTGQYEA